MGKTKWGSNAWQSKAGAQGGQSSASSQHWDQWDAQANWPAAPNAAPPAKAGVKFQDMKPGTNSKSTELLETDEPEREDAMARIPVIQKMINNVRKADARMRKCKELRSKREEQWSQYEEEIKKLFLSQKAEFRAETQRMDKEEHEAAKAKAAAVAQLKECINGDGQRTVPAPVQTVNAEDNAAWDELMRTTAPSPVKEPVDAWLQEMLHATLLGGMGALTADHKAKLNHWLEQPSGEAVPTTPKTSRTAAPPRTPTGGVVARPARLVGGSVPSTTAAYLHGPDTTAMCDPYQSSPGGGTECISQGIPKAPPLGAPAAKTPSPVPVRPKNGLVSPRTPVKQASKQPPLKPLGRTSLAEVVESKRAAAQEALGINVTQIGPQRFLINDDGDDGGGVQSDPRALTLLE